MAGTPDTRLGNGTPLETRAQRIIGILTFLEQPNTRVYEVVSIDRKSNDDNTELLVEHRLKDYERDLIRTTPHPRMRIKLGDLKDVRAEMRRRLEQEAPDSLAANMYTIGMTRTTYLINVATGVSVGKSI